MRYLKVVGAPALSLTQQERNARAREALGVAALELFAVHGFEGTSLSAIGVHAGYSRGLAQYHFATKEQLAESLLERIAERDTNTHILKLPSDASGAEAWDRLRQHLDDSWRNYVSMFESPAASGAARGEMILCATAIFSPHRGLRRKMQQSSDALVRHVIYALQLCVRDGVVRPDIDPRAVAVLYVTSIWGLANALFHNPARADQLGGSIAVLADFMKTLRPRAD